MPLKYTVPFTLLVIYLSNEISHIWSLLLGLGIRKWDIKGTIDLGLSPWCNQLTNLEENSWASDFPEHWGIWMRPVVVTVAWQITWGAPKTQWNGLGAAPGGSDWSTWKETNRIFVSNSPNDSNVWPGCQPLNKMASEGPSSYVEAREGMGEKGVSRTWV